MSLPQRSLCSFSPNLRCLRRFCLSDHIVDFDSEACSSLPIPSMILHPTNEDLLQYYLVTEEEDCPEESTVLEEKKFLEPEIKEKSQTIVSCFSQNNLEKPSEKQAPSIEENPIKEAMSIELKEGSEKPGFELPMSVFPCNCKKSKCLKLYCECFSKGRLCTSLCNCADCCNKEPDCKLRKLALRNTYLKNHKTDRDTEEILDLDLQTFVFPNSANKSLGCNCKKSHCKKKYCECFDEGRACGPNCKCEGCKNYLGVRIRGKKERGRRGLAAEKRC